MSTPTVEESKLDLTSMIDVVFLLIVFFVLVSEMAAAETEVLQLPEASEAVPDKPDEQRRLICNVTAAGRVVVRRKELSPAELEAEIGLSARTVRDPARPELSDLVVLIRGDVDAEYRTVQQILMACAKHHVWRVQLAAVQPGAR